MRVFRDLVFIQLCILSNAAFADALVETFDGAGDYADTWGLVDGFDLDEWTIDPAGVDLADPVFDGSGFQISLKNRGPQGGGLDLYRPVEIEERFVVRLEFQDLLVRETRGDMFSSASAFLTFYTLHPRRNSRQQSLTIIASGPADEAADFGLLSAASVRQFNGLDIAASSDLALEIAYYKDLSLVEWRYDSNSRDGIPSIEWATDNFVLDGGNRPHIAVSYSVGERGHVEGAFSHFRLAPIVAGDFNHDQAFDKWDANLLMESIRSGEVDLRRDLNNDSAVDLSDLDFWVHNLKNTYYGDANLDGEFNTGDLVRVFQFAEYEDSLADNSTWETGDWNADGDFTTSDLVRAFQDAGFEKGPRKNTMTVPEPAGRVLLLVAATGILIGRRTIGSLSRGVFPHKGT